MRSKIERLSRDMHVNQDRVAQRVTAIKRDGPLPGNQGAVKRDLGILSRFLCPDLRPVNLHESARIQGMGAGKASVEFDCSRKHVACRDGVVAAGSIEVFHSTQKKVVGGQTIRALAPHLADPSCLDLTPKGCDNRCGYLILDSEDCLKLAVVSFGP